MPSPRHDAPAAADRWPPLLLALRRAARPDRVRVAAYLSLTQRAAGWAAYTEFLAQHRAWIASLDGMLAGAGVNAPGPLPDAAEPFDAAAGTPPGTENPLAGLSPPRSRAHALGYLYVLEAFRLGSSVLARRIRGRAEPGADGRPWNELVAALAGVPAEDRPEVVKAAREAFSAWEQRLAASLAPLGLGPLSTDAHAA